MNNTDKKLDALIDALGFDVEQVNVNPRRHDRYPSEPIYDYKLTRRDEPTINTLAEIFGKHSHVNPSTLLKLQIIGILKRANKQPKKDAITLINAAIDEAFKNE
jgi:hypothetical protein